MTTTVTYTKNLTVPQRVAQTRGCSITEERAVSLRTRAVEQAGGERVLASRRFGNGCGPGGLPIDIGSRLVPDSFMGASFKEACEGHDRCYGTWGQSRRACDERFYGDLIASCYKTFSPLGADDPFLALCARVANLYFRGVRQLDEFRPLWQSRFMSGQMNACPRREQGAAGRAWCERNARGRVS